MRLSEGLRLWLERFGITTTFHGIRSNAHLVMFFVFGVILSLFGRECGWRWWVIILIGCGVGLIDEGIKVLLPTREFDATDLMRDFIGMVLAVGIVGLIRRVKAVK
ncbi:MAG: VanZ family protein [Oscillospiraceae bacterium]|nr:VanZ family protein [Oscillospiraceae bacterium]